MIEDDMEYVKPGFKERLAKRPKPGEVRRTLLIITLPTSLIQYRPLVSRPNIHFTQYQFNVHLQNGFDDLFSVMCLLLLVRVRCGQSSF